MEKVEHTNVVSSSFFWTKQKPLYSRNCFVKISVGKAIIRRWRPSCVGPFIFIFFVVCHSAIWLMIEAQLSLLYFFCASNTIISTKSHPQHRVPVDQQEPPWLHRNDDGTYNEPHLRIFTVTNDGRGRWQMRVNHNLPRLRKKSVEYRWPSWTWTPHAGITRNVSNGLVGKVELGCEGYTDGDTDGFLMKQTHWLV